MVPVRAVEAVDPVTSTVIRLKVWMIVDTTVIALYLSSRPWAMMQLQSHVGPGAAKVVNVARSGQLQDGGFWYAFFPDPNTSTNTIRYLGARTSKVGGRQRLAVNFRTIVHPWTSYPSGEGPT